MTVPALLHDTLSSRLELKPKAPSATEIHRIRRAFWRLLVYSDFFHGPDRKYPRSKGVCHDAGLSAFRNILTVSELEEIDCAYYHFSEQISHWEDPNSALYSPQLAARLLSTFGPVANAWAISENRNHLDENPEHITHFIGMYREMLGDFRDPEEAPEAKNSFPNTPEGANMASAGWQYLHAHNKALHLHQGDSRMNPVSCFLDWGYCVWDRSRLEAWRLIGPRARLEWWAYGQRRRICCAHCGSYWNAKWEQDDFESSSFNVD